VHERTFVWTNDTGGPIELVYEPDGMPIVVPRGACLRVVGSGSEDGDLEVEQGDDRIVVFGWPSSKAEIFLEGVLHYASPSAMPALAPGMSTRQLIRGLFGGGSR